MLTVASEIGISRPAVWRWQQRFAEAGVDGLLRDKTCKPGRPRLSAETVAKVLALPCTEAPGEATHWTGRAVARTAGVSLRAVQRIREAHRLQPHRIRTFKKSSDPAFATRSRTSSDVPEKPRQKRSLPASFATSLPTASGVLAISPRYAPHRPAPLPSSPRRS